MRGKRIGSLLVAACAATPLTGVTVEAAGRRADQQSIPVGYLLAAAHEITAKSDSASRTTPNGASGFVDADTSSIWQAPQLPEPVVEAIRRQDEWDDTWDALVVLDPSTATGWVAGRHTLFVTFPIATGTGGLSARPGSSGTPAGSAVVTGAVKAGEQEIIRYRRPTGRTATVNSSVAYVTSAAIFLEGLEPGNSTLASRNIYIHGTNRLSSLGKGALSGGCVRVHPAIAYLIADMARVYGVGVHILDRPWPAS